MSDLTLRIDPHVHSEASYDGSEPVELILEQAAEIGLDAVVITDHDVIYESIRAAELAPQYGLIGIPGVEVSTADGHLLALGVEEMPPAGESVAETAAWVRSHGGVSVVAHPFQRSRHGVRRRALSTAEFDAIEVYNSWLFTGYKNRRARRYARAHDYPGMAGSDAHKVPYVGRAYTEVRVPDVTRETVTARAVLDAILDGDTHVRGRRTPIPVSARHYGIGATRKSGYYAKVGTRRGGHYAKVGTLRGGYYAKVAARMGVGAALSSVRAGLHTLTSALVS
ncbi:MAG: CehA/McbA family metallohydrolase [Salinigranum sp.]